MKTQVTFLVAFRLVTFLTALESGAVPQKLKCLPGITRFSKRDSVKHFYECHENEEPVLVACEDDLLYNMNKQKCMKKEEQEKVFPKDEKALGRNIQLGSLYDARKNIFFPEASFWSTQTISASMQEFDKFDVNLEVSSSKRTLDKTNHFDISASLTLDFMGGMVEVSGSGGYLKDEVSSENEVNVELSYHTTKKVRTLSRRTIKDYGFECTKGSQYTHVVTSATYGLDAVFVFKRMLESHETEESIVGNLEIAINKIPGASISGEGSVDITSSDKEAMEHTTLKMYGDFSPESPLPTTFESAIEFYKNVPLLADVETDELAILEVHLTPITDICTPEDFFLAELSDEMVEQATKILDELEQLNTKVISLMNTHQAQKFKPLRENLNLYRKALQSYQLEAKMKLASILPNIRGGTGHGEDDLILLLANYTASQFYFETSSEFLIDRNREIQAIRFLEENFPVESNIDIADYESANDVEFIFKRNLVVVLEFNILSSKDLTQNFLDGNRKDESGFWYNNVTINGEVGEILRSLKLFALENIDQQEKGYLVKVSPIKELEEEHAFVMSALIKGNVLSNEYRVPLAPEIPIPYAISHENFKFDVKKWNDFTLGVKVFITNMQNGDTYEEDKLFPASALTDSEVEIMVGGLLPASIYKVQLKYLTDVGTSPPSKQTGSFATLPTSLPQSLSVDEITSEFIKLSWEPPAFISEGLTVEELKYAVLYKGENDYEKVFITEICNFTMMEPLDATQYSFDVRVYTDRKLLTAEPCDDCESKNRTKLGTNLEDFNQNDTVAISLFSKPLPPKLLQMNDAEVTLTSAVLRWDPPRLAYGASLTHFVLEYTAMNENGTDEFSGTKGYVIEPENNNITVNDLTPGAVYAFKAKIVTSEGESDFSIRLMFQTKFDDTDLDQAEKRVFRAIDDLREKGEAQSSFCGYKDSLNIDGSVLYDSIFISNNTVNGADLNKSTGKFTAGADGVYKVMFAMEILSVTSEEHEVCLVKNGERIEESRMHSDYNVYGIGTGSDNGSRELFLNLKAEDTVGLIHESSGSSQLISVTFCVTAINPEMSTDSCIGDCPEKSIRNCNFIKKK